MVTIVTISGSLRKESYNSRALICAREIAEEQGAQIIEISPNTIEILPLFNEDVEIPESVHEMKDVIEGADIIMIASPEYNHSIPGGLKNCIDWISSGEKNPFKNKVGIIMGVSTGGYGTIRAQKHLREVLAALSVYVLPQPELYIGPAHALFNDDGELVDEKTISKMRKLIEASIQYAEKIK